MLPLAAFSQSTLYFSYDAAGNQVLRDVVCINCSGSITSLAKNIASDEEMTVSTESLTAFPNPVTQKLRVQWMYGKTNPLQALQLCSAAGSLLQKLPVKIAAGQTELDFSSYPPGPYLLMGIRANGKITTIKITRQ
jgi:hypothetical protein